MSHNHPANIHHSIGIPENDKNFHLGRVKTLNFVGDRRTFYVPDMSMRQLLTGLMNETLMPHLRNSNDHIEQMRELPEDSHPGRKVLRERVGQHQRLAARGSQGPAGAAQDGGDRVRFV